MRLKFLFILIIFTLFSISSSQIYAQETSIDVENLSDEQITEMWAKAQADGFTIEQFKTLALARGIPSSQVNVLVNRINSQSINKAKKDIQENGIGEEIKNTNEEEEDNKQDNQIGLKGGEYFDDPSSFKQTKNPIFGLDFFNNPNISFTPSLNLSTPKNYILGPGDQLVINLWGAGENTYTAEIDKEGTIRIENVGPIYLNGLPFSQAKEKIKSSLQKVYAGINAPNRSPYKIFLDISIAKTRTIQVNIIGQIRVPGTYSLNSFSTILNALYAAGGPTKEGTLRDIKLSRNGQIISHFDVYQYLLNGSQEGNLTLQDQDVIIVSPYLSKVSVSGSVKRPGIFELKSHENFQNLLNYMGGFKAEAYKDKITLERIEGNRKTIKEINLKDGFSLLLKDGDVILVKKIVEKFENRVQIVGAVYRGGSFEFTEGLSVLDLINKAAGVTENAFLERGLIFRTEDGVSKSTIPFSISDVLDGKSNISLQAKDIVKIYDKYNLMTKQSLTIDGAVNNPTVIPFMKNMTIKDLVLIAGGFSEEADAGTINVFRKIKDNDFETLSKTFKLNDDGTLTIDNKESFYLEPNDKVSIRFLKGHNEQKRVRIEGEVNYPGNYSIEMKNERISDLIERSGGLSPYAFVEGATLIRVNPYFRDLTINNVLDNINTNIDTTNNVLLNNKKEFKVGIDLKKILKDGGKESKHNLVLQDGDILVIPSVKETVKVQGEILAPSLVRFDKTNNLRDYINKSGGFSINAKRSKTFVIYSNGDIATTRNFLFFRSYPKLKPGAIILVPEKPEGRSISAQEVIGISTSLTTFGLLIDRLLR
ncbi:MAG: SLBB domain-containing protein [Flavobacteriales bacterium]